MISSLIYVTRMDARTMAERRIHSADVMDMSGSMLGGCLEADSQKESGEEETWCVHHLVQTTGAKGSTRPSHSSGFFPRVRKHLAEIPPAAGYRYVCYGRDTS